MSDRVHPDLQGSGFAYLFDVTDAAMEANVGRRILLHNPMREGGIKAFGNSGDFVHVIRSIQRIHNGRLAYRANILDPEHGEQTFGRPVSPEEIAAWLPEGEPS